MQKVRGHSEELPLFVGIRFQDLFQRPPGLLFTFPSRYWFTIGRWVVLRLGGRSPLLPPGFHVPQGTLDLSRLTLVFVYGGVTLYPVPFQTLPLTIAIPHSGPQPRFSYLKRFGLFPVRSPLLRESLLISFPSGT